jgi:hypothetical protein
MTDLDKKLIEIAVLNPKQFISLMGEDAWRSAKVCLLRQDGKSYGEIANKLSIPEHQARYGCNKCDVPKA